MQLKNLLWESVCNHIESTNDVNVVLQKMGLENRITAENAFIQDSGGFYITTVSESKYKIVIGMEI